MVLRLGLVGRGPWGKNIERTLLSFPDVDVLPVARNDVATAGLDAVLVSTPSASHAKVALPYIEAGLPTFIEKPMATTVADAELLRDAAARSGAPVFVGHLFLHHPAFERLLEILPTLGSIRYVLNDSANNQARNDSSVLWDWLPHDLSMARAIFGTDARVAESWPLWDTVQPKAALSKFAFGETSVVCTTSWLSSHRRKRLTVVCEGGTLVFDDRAEHKLSLHDSAGDLSFPACGDQLPLSRELERFVRAVRLRADDPSQIEAGVAIVRMIAAAEESSKAGGRPVGIVPANQQWSGRPSMSR